MARITAEAFIPDLVKSSISMPALIDSSLYISRKPVQIVIDSNGDSREMASAANGFLLPNRLLLHAGSGPSQEFLGRRLNFIRGTRPIDGESTTYVCEDFVCQIPARSPQELRSQLENLIK